jgi:hypothetical protein
MENIQKIDMHIDNDLVRSVRKLELPEDIQRDVFEVLGGLEGLMREHGYRSIFENNIFRNNTVGRVREAIGRSSDINIIPGSEAGICCPLALAICKGESPSRPYGFRNVMRKVRSHMIDCFYDTGAVMIVTDVWSPRLLEESLGDLESHRSKGKKILFFLVNGSKLSLVEAI